MPKNAVELSKAFGFLFLDEVAEMRKTVNLLPYNSVCVNIGAGVGTSGLIFMESDKVAALYSIDKTGGVSPLGGLGNELGMFKEAGYGNDQRYHQIVGDSTQVGLNWKNGIIDMLFIDGDHSYEHCLSDAKSFLPHIRNGGVISFHDYAETPWIGVWKCVNEHFKGVYPMIALAHTFVAFRVLQFL